MGAGPDGLRRAVVQLRGGGDMVFGRLGRGRNRLAREVVPVTALAVPVLLATASWLSGEDARKWIGDSQENIATLIYGVPRSDDAPIAFRCELPAHDFFVTLAMDPNFEPKAGTVPLTLTAPPSTEQLALEADILFIEDMEVTFLEAKPAFDVPIARMLKQGSELRFTLGEKTFVYPLAGAADAMGPIEAACAKPT